MELPEYTRVHTNAGTGEIVKRPHKPSVIIRDPESGNRMYFGKSKAKRIFINVPEKGGDRLWVLKPSEANKLIVPLPVGSEFICVLGSITRVGKGFENIPFVGLNH